MEVSTKTSTTDAMFNFTLTSNQNVGALHFSLQTPDRKVEIQEKCKQKQNHVFVCRILCEV